MRTKLRTGLLSALALLVVLSCSAQDTATITGLVQDPTGAVVVGAQITVANTATNVESASQTNEEGMYRVPSLRPGSYRVTVSASGFKKFVRAGVELRVGSVMPVDASLEVGAVSDTVEVTAVTPLLETETSATGHVVEGEFFYRMPMFQRYSKSMLYLTPGVTFQGQAWAASISGFIVNGVSGSNMGLFEDGMLGVGLSGNTTETIQNTIEEIKVLTTVLPAEYGHSAGGAITIVKKSGTNQLHGLASEYARYGGMQHRAFFDKYKLSQPRPGLPRGDTVLYQLPDGNVSGPVYLPKLYDGHNKTFFMLAMQRMIEKKGLQTMYDVPTAAELAGDFTYPDAVAAGLTVQPIFNPRTIRQLPDGKWVNDPFGGNVIPPSQIDPVMTKFLSFKPWSVPNMPGTPTTTGPTNNFFASAGRRAFWNSYSVRLDHQATSRLKTFANWTYNSRRQRLPLMDIDNSEMFDNSRNMVMDYYNTAGIGGTWVLSPTLISDTRIGYFRNENATNSIAYGKNYAGKFGIPNVDATSMPGGFPISIGNPSLTVQETFSVREDVSKMTGKHAFKMGYDLLRIRQNSWTKSNTTGSFSFAGCNSISSNGSPVPITGNSWCNYWVGAVSSYSVSINLLSQLPRNWMHSLYFQDDWKVLPNLTVNAGVRWMAESPPNNKYGQQSRFNPTAPDNTAIGFLGVIEHPAGSMYNKDWNNFQPRVGLAWHARKNIVIRTGFALSTVDLRLQNPPTNEYGSITATQNRPSGDFRPMFQISAGPNLPIQWPTVRADGSIPFSGSNYSGRGATWVNPNRVNPYSMNWNFGIQYALSPNYLVELEYTGNRSVKGFETWEMNGQPFSWASNLRQTNPAEFTKMEGNSQPYRPFTNFGSISYQAQGANAAYHSGIVKLEKRYSYGLTFLAYYTYSKGIDSSTGNIHIPRSLDRGRSSWDRTHQFTSSMNYEVPIGKGRKWMNRGGIWNLLFGGYDMVWTYLIYSGNPLTFGMSSSPNKYMPGIVAQRGGRPDSTGQAAHLRDNWQDLGGDRWTQSNQNKLIESMSYFTYPAAYTMGNVGRNTMDAQRLISANFSASKEVKVKERLTFQFRYDFQNPFKWYTLGNPNTTVNFANPGSFGTITPSGELSSSVGGIPVQHLTLALRF